MERAASSVEHVVAAEFYVDKIEPCRGAKRVIRTTRRACARFQTSKPVQS